MATLTRKFVDASTSVQVDTKARVYDTRKTTPGWRRLEKYAVRMGGGRNHRMGLYDAVLIKDNHLALTADPNTGACLTPAEAVTKARTFLQQLQSERSTAPSIVEVEVDTLRQLAEVLPAAPDIVLLDNFTVEQLRQAVAQRDREAPHVQLEASGGVDLASIGVIAASGVERISVGALTHSATQLDLALDWR